MKYLFHIAIVMLSVGFLQCSDEGYETLNKTFSYDTYFLQHADSTHTLYIVVDSCFRNESNDTMDLTNPIRGTKNGEESFVRNLNGSNLWYSNTSKDITDFNGYYEISYNCQNRITGENSTTMNYFNIRHDTITYMAPIRIYNDMFTYDGNTNRLTASVYYVRYARTYGFVITSGADPDNQIARANNKYCETNATKSYISNDSIMTFSYDMTKLKSEPLSYPLYIKIYVRSSEGVRLETERAQMETIESAESLTFE